MKYTIEIKDQDYLAYNSCFLKKTDVGKRYLRNYKLQGPLMLLVILAAFAVFGLNLKTTLVLAGLYAIFSVLWFLIAEKMLWRKTKSNLKKMRKHGKLPYTEKSKMEFDDDKITETTDKGEHSIGYDKISQIYYEEEYIFAFYNGANGFVIPLHCFGDDKKKVVEYLKSKIDK